MVSASYRYHQERNNLASQVGYRGQELKNIVPGNITKKEKQVHASRSAALTELDTIKAYSRNIEYIGVYSYNSNDFMMKH